VGSIQCLHLIGLIVIVYGHTLELDDAQVLIDCNIIQVYSDSKLKHLLIYIFEIGIEYSHGFSFVHLRVLDGLKDGHSNISVDCIELIIEDSTLLVKEIVRYFQFIYIVIIHIRSMSPSNSVMMQIHYTSYLCIKHWSDEGRAEHSFLIQVLLESYVTEETISDTHLLK
jgi:hypothetical protein